MRKVIKIDESLCKGCGECVTACAEGAIEIVDGKARVVSDSFCDGLGACLSICPQAALTLVEREAEDFDGKAAKERLKATVQANPGGDVSVCQENERQESGHKPGASFSGSATPCTFPITIEPAPKDRRSDRAERHRIVKTGKPGESELCGWPIQMRLVRPWAPYLKGAHLLVAGDCTAFAYPDIQKDFIRGRAVLVGCPKLDDTEPFVDRLTEILKDNEILDISVLHMTVPCCAQLSGLVSEAVKRSGKDVAQKSYVVGIDGILQNK